MNEWSMFKRQMSREWALHCQNPRQMIHACIFFILVLIFFPLTISPEMTTLRVISPGIIWISLLLACFLSSERLFQQDYDDGIIEQWIVSGYSCCFLVTAKVLVHWFLTVIPMLLLFPFVGMLLHLSLYEIMILIISILCGSPAILFLCALGAAFSTGLKQKGILMPLILFPLTIPVMIFGGSTLTSAMQGLPVHGYLAFLLAFSIIAIGFIPLAISGVMRMSLVD